MRSHLQRYDLVFEDLRVGVGNPRVDQFDIFAVAPLFAAWATNGLFLAVGLVFFVRALWR